MKKIKVWAGILISLAFIFIIFRNFNSFDFRSILRTLTKINYLFILPFVAVQLASYWVRSIRWSVMLRSIKKVKASSLFPIVCISYMSNNTLPLRAGEVIRAYLIGKKEGISKTAAFSTIILERIYDGITLLLILGTISFLFPFPDWVKSIGLITAVVFAGALAFTFVLVRFRTATLSITGKMLKFLPQKAAGKVLKILDKLIEGFDVVKDKRNFIPIAIYSIMVWLMEASLIYAISVAFGFEKTVYLALFTLVVVNLGIMIPSSPGYVGPFEFFCIKSLGFFGVEEGLALGFALIFRVFELLPVIVIGIVFLVKEGLTLSSLSKLGDSQTNE